MNLKSGKLITDLRKFERIAKLPPRHFLRRVASRTDLNPILKSIFCTSENSTTKDFKI